MPIKIGKCERDSVRMVRNGADCFNFILHSATTTTTTDNRRLENVFASSAQTEKILSFLIYFYSLLAYEFESIAQGLADY